MSPDSHGLPGVLGEIAEIAGLDAAFAVARAVGGTRVYIPRRPGPDHWLLQAVGTEAAAKIVDHFTTNQSGTDLDIPVGPDGSYNRGKRERTKRIAELRAQGLMTHHIARRVGVTRRTVQNVNRRLDRSRDDDPQGDLGL